MALHRDLESLLKESFPEYLEAAKYCIRYQKNASWGVNQIRGCLGYPGTALLFTIADSIGSYFKKDVEYTVPLEGKPYSIKKTTQHFYIFNSDYYGLSLDKRTIEELYNNYRGPLIHNTAIPPEYYLFVGCESEKPFILSDKKVHINVRAFLYVSEIAVEKFIRDISVVVPNSQQSRDILSKK